jgi:heat shock protein HslJ
MAGNGAASVFGQTDKRRRLLAVFVAGLFALMIVSEAMPDTAHADQGRLWGRSFVATSVRGREGRQTPIARPSDVHVSFSKSHGQWIGWEANCNGFGARVRIRGGRLKLREVVSTAVGCPGRWEQEDRWLDRFFGANPYWRLHGTHLKLWLRGRVVRLKEKAD